MTLIHLLRRLRPIRALLTLLLATSAHAAELTVVIKNIESTSGRLMIAVQSSEAAFNGSGAPVVSLMLPPRPGELSFSTNALESGDYAIRVMHDENGNGELDTNMVGMPTEPWGFSNNVSGAFGPPQWEAAKVSVSGATSTTINLNQ